MPNIPPQPDDDRGRYAYPRLDRLFHERARLGVLTALHNRPKGASFVELRRLCSLTDGNLNRHLAALIDARVVRDAHIMTETKELTFYRLTPRGKQQFARYLDALKKVIDDNQAK